MVFLMDLDNIQQKKEQFIKVILKKVILMVLVKFISLGLNKGQ